MLLQMVPTYSLDDTVAQELRIQSQHKKVLLHGCMCTHTLSQILPLLLLLLLLLVTIVIITTFFHICPSAHLAFEELA